MYSVDKQDAQTLIHLTERTSPPEVVYFQTVGLPIYTSMNLGYEHCSVTHKSTFKQSYRNVQTGEIVVCTTNRIDGAWEISRDHFRRINGTNTADFEQHLSEFLWMNHVHNKNIYDTFF